MEAPSFFFTGLQEACYLSLVILMITVILVWYCREQIKNRAVKIVCVLLVLCLVFWPWRIIGVISPPPPPPLPPPPSILPQLSQPCEVYTRTQLGDIAVYDDTPAQTYVENQRLAEAIEEAVLQLTPEGIWVLYSPTGGGKTAAITRVLHRLFLQGKIKVLELDAGPSFASFIMTHGDKHLLLIEWLQHAMGCTNRFSSFHVSDIFPYDKKQPRSVLFIDHFGSVINHADIEKVRKMMSILAYDVANRKNYIALVATANLDLYNAMLTTWNGGEKFQAVVEGGFIWTPVDFQAVVDSYKDKGFMAPHTASQPALHEAMKSTTTIRNFLRFLRNNKMVDFSNAKEEE